MSLIKCPECGRAISSLAESCPHCGYKLEKYSFAEKPILKKYSHSTAVMLDIFLVFCAVVIFVIFLLMKEYQPEEVSNINYKTYEVSGVKVTELYKYPEFGFNVIKVDKLPITQKEKFEFFDDVSSLFPMEQYWTLEVYIYDYNVDVTSIKNAPKKMPLDMSVAAEKLHPVATVTKFKDTQYDRIIGTMACIDNIKRGKYDEYSKGFDNINKWQWTYKADGKACNLDRELISASSH